VSDLDIVLDVTHSEKNILTEDKNVIIDEWMKEKNVSVDEWLRESSHSVAATAYRRSVANKLVFTRRSIIIVDCSLVLSDTETSILL